MQEHRAEIEKLISEAMKLAGFDLEDANLKETPRRIASVWQEFKSPVDLSAILKAQFPSGGPDHREGLRTMVVQQDIPFQALCEHHFLPFFGKAAIGYVPKERVVGLSKLSRLVGAAGRMKPTIQEKITYVIADTLSHSLGAMGVIVVVEAEHTCMSVRGVRAIGTTTTTSAVRGVFRDVPAARQEFFDLIRGKR